MKRIMFLVGCILGFSIVASCKADDQYEIGGPLAGIKLPPYPTYFGEPPGKPGNSAGAPQQLLYPGSVENWRSYFFKYCPVRSLFDSQTQLKNWTAPEIPGAAKSEVAKYAQPIYKVPKQAGGTATGNFEPAVEVLKISPGQTILETSLGKLSKGLYCLRVIAAVGPEDDIAFRKDLFISMEVDDLPDGGLSHYRKRIGYVDQFYSIAEFYFHAPSPREYKVKLQIDPESKVGLLVRNVSFDDVFAGFECRPIKKKSNNPFSPEIFDIYMKWLEKVKSSPAELAKRQKDDDLIWRGSPGLNKQRMHFLRPGSEPYSAMTKFIHDGANNMPYKELEEKYGKWTAPGGNNPESNNVLLENKKLNLKYTVEDLIKLAPLPDPYPVKDNGVGVASPDPGSTESGWFCAPITFGVTERVTKYQNMFVNAEKLLPSWTGVAEKMHDSLVAFARFVYDYPTYDNIDDISVLIRHSGPFTRQATRQRMTDPFFLTHYTEYSSHVEKYDRYYNFIKGNQLLADSIGRHIPWVKTPDDVIELFDTYLVQNTARRILRYHYYVNPEAITRVAAVLGDAGITKPWMEWQFKKTFIYPLPIAGIQHLTVNGHDRSGIEYGVSSYYGCGENATRVGQGLDAYCKAVGDDTFSMTKPGEYPKIISACYWPLRMMCAGYQYTRIGDVTGPDKIQGAILNSGMEDFKRGWMWTKDPAFAALLRYADKPSNFSVEEWKEIDKSASTLSRMPSFSQPSRFVPNWCGILETGKKHDDFRFRQSAMVRVGYGYGHHHDDSLDLQLCANGLPFVVDSGQRPGYCNPSSGASCLHNTVTINGKDRGLTIGYVDNIVDASGFAYMDAKAGVSKEANKGERQVTLVNVDDVSPARSLPMEKQLPNVKLEQVAKSDNAYVFDVFREKNPGKLRYNFHAMVNDEFTWNAINEKQKSDVFEGIFKSFPQQSFAASSPDTLEAVWRMRRVPVPPLHRMGTEQQNMGVNFDPASPVKFLKLHLFNVKDALLERAEAATGKEGIENQFTCIGATVDDKNGRVFSSIIEPYEGTTFIKSASFVEIPGNEDDADAATAALVTTVNGLENMHFCDGRPEKTRTFDNITVSGEAAFVSNDEKGVSKAMLTGGTLLKTPGIKITCAKRGYSGEITSIDYKAGTFDSASEFPEISSEQIVSIMNKDYSTSYTVTGIKKISSGNYQFKTISGADMFASPVTSVDPESGIVKTDLSPFLSIKGRTVTNCLQNKFWRINEKGMLTGKEPVTKESFAPENEIRGWEYGPGDKLFLPSRITVERSADGKYHVEANIAVEISILDKITGKWSNLK